MIYTEYINVYKIVLKSRTQLSYFVIMFGILAPYHFPIKAIREQTLPLVLLYLLITKQMS